MCTCSMFGCIGDCSCKLSSLSTDRRGCSWALFLFNFNQLTNKYKSRRRRTTTTNDRCHFHLERHNSLSSIHMCYSSIVDCMQDHIDLLYKCNSHLGVIFWLYIFIRMSNKESTTVKRKERFTTRCAIPIGVRIITCTSRI